MEFFKGLHPTEIASGYEKALEMALEILPELVVSEATDLRDVQGVQKYLKSAVMSKQYGNEEFITDLVAKACGEFFCISCLNHIA